MMQKSFTDAVMRYNFEYGENPINQQMKIYYIK